MSATFSLSFSKLRSWSFVYSSMFSKTDTGCDADLRALVIIEDSGDIALATGCSTDASIESAGGTSWTDTLSSGDSDFVLSRSSRMGPTNAPRAEVDSLPIGESGIAERSISLLGRDSCGPTRVREFGVPYGSESA